MTWRDWLHNRITVARRGSRPPLELTDRDRDVAVLVAKGMTDRADAAGLYASSKAIDYHLGHIFGKLGIASGRDLRQRCSTRRCT
jgi:DNA-binding CsgD family transcriptional regulator